MNLWHTYLQWKTPPADADKAWCYRQAACVRKTCKRNATHFHGMTWYNHNLGIS